MKIKPMIYQKDRKIELLYKETYKNYNYYILNLGTHPTAYIEIPKGNILYELDYNEIYDKGYGINVHGGLTYSDHELMMIPSENWYIGWDYAHYDDYMPYMDDIFMDLTMPLHKWTTEEIIEECKNAIEQIIVLEENNGKTNKA